MSGSRIPSLRRRGFGINLGFRNKIWVPANELRPFRSDFGFQTEIWVPASELKDHPVEEEGDASMDIFSQLPQPVLHHILCFLSQKEAFQTRAIAKSWRFHGPTRPKFDFRESDFAGDQHSFIGVIVATIDRCLKRKLSLHEFRLEMSEPNYLSTAFLEVWIPLVLDNMSVKTFHLSFVSPRKPYFDLPPKLFQADSIENLSLQYCTLNKNPVQELKLGRLKSLSLKGACIEDETLNILLSGCPLIEDLVLDRCPWLGTVVVDKSVNLKHFHYCDWVTCNRVEGNRVEISIETIETIKIEGSSKWFHRHRHDDGDHLFPLLHSLYLSGVQLSSESFDCLSCHFPGLENLTLVRCYGFEQYQLLNRSIKHLRIEGINMFDKAAIDDGNHLFPFVESLCMVNVRLSSELFKCLSCHFPSLEKFSLVNCHGPNEYQLSSQSIKHLRIEGPHVPAKVVIHVPNLEQFEYEGGVTKSISFEKTSVDWRSKVVVRSEVDSKCDASVWCLELYETLQRFVGSKISLDIINHFRGHHKRARDCPPSLVAARTLEPIVVERLSMRLMRHSTSSSSAYINNMFCICRPRNMTQFMYTSPRGAEATEHNQISEYLQKVLLSERVMRQCNLWKQDLEEAEMEKVSKDAERDEVQFRLKWKER